ncbi:MAG: glycosyltransferase [Chitinivibrionales bacterium]|nr:glycosyltransferase [Chitinivibrionales bacterium]
MIEIPDKKLSVCMIARDEAHTIGACLSSIAEVADEIIVVDTGSKDNTISVVKEYGAIVVESQWRDDFSYSRNISLCHATAVWILWLDADDFLPQESVALLTSLKQREPADTVYAMIVRNQKADGTGSEFFQARMFPNHRGIYFQRPIHEQFLPKAVQLGFHLESTAIVIEHRGYATTEEMKRKAQRNVNMLLHASGDSTQSLDIVTALEIADSYTILEDDAAAKTWYERVLSFSSLSAEYNAVISQAYMGLGNCANRSLQFDQARDCFLKAHSICKERSDVLYCLAVSYEMLGEIENAINTLAEIFRMKPVTLAVGVNYLQTELKAYLRYCRLLAQSKKWKELEVCIKKAVEKHTRPEILNMAGVASYQMNCLLDALHYFEKSISLAKEGNIDAFAGLCMIYKYVQRSAVIEMTINSLYAKSQTNPRYWALCSILSVYPFGISSQSSEIPKEKLDNEIQYLQNTFQFLK